MISMRLRNKDNWRTMVKVEAAFATGMEKAVDEMANMIVADVKASWYPGTPPAPLGSPPAIVTGVLDEGTTKENQGRTPTGQFAAKGNGAVRFIRFDTAASGDGQYAGVLEDRGHPFIEPALIRASAAFGGVIKASIRWR